MASWSLRRIAVGNHILGRRRQHGSGTGAFGRRRFRRERASKLDPWQSVSLWHACRAAKETLVRRRGAEKASGGGPGPRQQLDRRHGFGRSGSQGGRASACWTGFFPLCAVPIGRRRRRASGFREIGLPFESDTAITRHLAAFLTAQWRCRRAARSGRRTCCSTAACSRPTCCASDCCEVIGDWFGAEAARQRASKAIAIWIWPSLAAPPATAWPSKDSGVRIRGGAARSYYVGIETAGLAIPGAAAAAARACASFRSAWKKGPELDVPGGEIGLVVGEQASFRFFSSAVRKQDKPGDLIATLDRGRDLRNRFARSNAARRPTIWKTPMCRCGFIRKSRNWACSNCGASARFPTTAGSWNSAFERMRTRNDEELNRKGAKDAKKQNCDGGTKKGREGTGFRLLHSRPVGR